jgi:TonB-dependent receptor
MRYFYLIAASCFLLLNVSSRLAAQNYSVTGRVVDAANREPLPGATISIEKTTQGAVTDAEGYFSLQNISQKEITLQIAMLGYETQLIRHNFSKKTNPEFKVSLKATEFTLGEVEITGKAEGQIKAMIEQKKAESIKNIVSAEQIATFPDMNAAEVMQRIPGITLQRDQGEGRYVQLRGTPPQLTNFNINGEQIPSPEGGVRFVGMDIIPADQIDFIEVSKVMTPDMDADGIGGSVNVKTKEAADTNPDIRATLSAGYNNLRQTPNYQMQYAYGQRYGRFGFHINASYFQNNQGADNVEFDFAKGPFFGSQGSGENNYFVQFREVQLRHYDITRTRISVAPTLDYQFSKNSFVYLRAMYNRFSDEEVRRRKIYELDDALSYQYYLYGGVAHDIKAREKIQQLSTLSLGGEHKIGGATIDYQLFMALAREEEPDRLEADFESPGQAIAIQFNLSDPDYPRAEFPNPSNAPNATDYDNFELDELLLENRLVTDVNFTPRINITFPYSLTSSNHGYIKFGAKIRAKNKKRDIQSQQFGAYFERPLGYPGEGPKLSLHTVNDGFVEDDLLNQGYLLDYMPSPGLLRDFYEFYPQHFVFDRTATKTQSFGEDYDAKERIYAAYGMIRHDFNRLMLIMGLRYERTDIDYTGSRILLNGNLFVGIDTLTDRRTHEFLLPQVQLKYAVNDRFNLRAAWTYTYSRPNFDDVLPYREQDREEVKFGNPDLRYPRSTNIDFLAENYFRKGIISGGLFFKQIDDFVFFFKRFAHEGDPEDFGLVEITKAINGKRAFVYGAEFQAQTKFYFLPGILRNFGVYTNYTYTYSEAKINKRFPANFTNAIVVFGEDDLSVFSSSEEEETITLPGQARHTANLALFYDAKRFFARLTANYHDAFLYQLGADKDLDEYYDQEFRLDFTANYDLSRHLNAFVDVINLTNTPLRYYLDTPDRIKKQEFYSWWCRAGIKLNF